VGITLSAVGMVETATYALAVGGTLFCALALAADVLTLTMPSAVAHCGIAGRSLFPRGAQWRAGAAVTVANLRGRARPADRGHRAQHGPGTAGAAQEWAQSDSRDATGSDRGGPDARLPPTCGRIRPIIASLEFHVGRIT
jgi:hypothetical protein